MSKVAVVVRMDGQIIRGRCWFARGDDSAGDEGERDGVTLKEEMLVRGRCQGRERVMQMAKKLPRMGGGVTLNRFKSEYVEPSLRGTLGTRSGSCSASCLADLGLHELEGEGTGRSS